ncbi:hypothetical protein [Undibacterium sp.]|jgi:hypothetical protein|uniref:hypothetical protein n=1 Tax=Undibacterium sp. TaxID=1914977 RepID=UPI002D1AB929|nr:hypothetical protein [Undibacterium sp.]HTD07219.1 hypothetical protein [Undibacterium sp.]
MRLLIAGLIVNLLISASAVQAGDISSSREVVIEAGVNPIAHSISIAPDNSIVVAGQIWGDGSAWAIGADKDGRVRWRITVPRETSEPASKTAFNDSAILENGHTVVCGHIGVDRFSKRPGYLLFLDGDGRKIGDKRFYPSGDEAFDLSEISKCAAWNGGIITIGKTLKFHPQESVPSREIFYWITFWSTNGDMLWERVLPISIDQVDKINSMQITTDGHVVFCGEGGSHSEIVRVDTQGQIVARAGLPGRYLLVQSVRKSASIQAIPRTPGMPWELITMDELLKVTHRTLPGKKLDAILSAAWAIGDDEFFAFGEILRHSVPREAIAIKASQDLHSIGILDTPSLADSYQVDAVTYSQSERRFVMAHTFLRKTTPKGTSLTFLKNN